MVVHGRSFVSAEQHCCKAADKRQRRVHPVDSSWQVICAGILYHPTAVAQSLGFHTSFTSSAVVPQAARLYSHWLLCHCLPLRPGHYKNVLCIQEASVSDPYTQGPSSPLCLSLFYGSHWAASMAPAPLLSLGANNVQPCMESPRGSMQPECTCLDAPLQVQ